jgi:hypothetical protein
MAMKWRENLFVLATFCGVMAFAVGSSIYWIQSELLEIFVSPSSFFAHPFSPLPFMSPRYQYHPYRYWAALSAVFGFFSAIWIRSFSRTGRFTRLSTALLAIVLSVLTTSVLVGFWGHNRLFVDPTEAISQVWVSAWLGSMLLVFSFPFNLLAMSLGLKMMYRLSK